MSQQTVEANLVQTLKNRDWKPADRARVLKQSMEETPKAAIAAVETVLGDFDELLKIERMLKEMKSGPAVPEYIVKAKGGLLGSSCVVTNGSKVVHVPVDPEFIEGVDGKPVVAGTPILVSQQYGLIVGIDDCPVRTGVATTVEKILDDGMVVVDHAPEKVVCHVANAIKGKLNSGDKVIAAIESRFVLERLEAVDNQNDVLVPLADVDAIDLTTLAELNPAIEEIMVRAEALTKHPEWIEALGVRPTCSYMFCGPTGTGKTTALNIIAKRLADWSGECGERQSRLVRADTSTFFSALFGETEQRIKGWFDKIRRAGAMDTKIPLLVVLEEGEALFRSRGEESSSSHLFDRPLSLFLSLASSIGQELTSPMIFVITSNQPKLMDAAALRRFGMRRVQFGYLTKAQAKAVLLRRLPEKDRCGDLGKELVEWMYEDESPIAEISFKNGKKPILKRDLVTPSIIEESLSQAADDCLRDSVAKNRLQKMTTDRVGERMEQAFGAVIRGLADHPRNLEQILPDWKAEHGNAISVAVL